MDWNLLQLNILHIQYQVSAKHCIFWSNVTKKRGTLTWISYTWAMWNWTVGTKRGTDQHRKSFSNGNTAFKSDIRPNIKPAFFVFTVSVWVLISLGVYRHREGRILACPLCTSSMSLLPVCKATHGWIQSCSFPGNWSLRQDWNGKRKNLIEEILIFHIKISQRNNKHSFTAKKKLYA